MGQEQSTNQGNPIPVEFDSDIANRNNRSNQKNPNNDVYWSSRSYDRRPDDWEEKRGVRLPRENDDNRSRQLNPNHPLYLKSRGQSTGQSNESKDVTYNEADATEEATSSLDNVMWWMKTAGQVYLACEIGRQVYNELAAETPQQEEERRRPRND